METVKAVTSEWSNGAYHLVAIIVGQLNIVICVLNGKCCGHCIHLGG